MNVDLEDLKKIIKREKISEDILFPRIVGVLIEPQHIKDLVYFDVGSPVYELNDRYFLEQGNIRVPYYKHVLSKVIKFY